MPAAGNQSQPPPANDNPDARCSDAKLDSTYNDSDVRDLLSSKPVRFGLLDPMQALQSFDRLFLLALSF